MTKLYILNGLKRGRSFDIKGATTFVGRAPDNDIQIEDNSVSRRHLRILRNRDMFLVEDLGSQNGTLVNGQAIKPGNQYEVKEGFPIVIGNILISLGKMSSDDRMAVRHSINLSERTGDFGESLVYKDKRFTKRKDLETIHEISTMLMTTLDINDICEKIMNSLFSLFSKIDNGAILLVDNETGELKEILSRSRHEGKGIKYNYSRTIVDRVMREGKAVIMADTSREDTAALSESMEMMRIKSVMCVPLISKSQTQGVVYLHSVNTLQEFQLDDLYLLTALSSPAALAIQNASLYSQRKKAEEELRKAHRELYKFNQELERKIQDRTQELNVKNKELVETERLAAQGKMANRVAHELRNPLTVVGGLTRRLYEKMPDDDPRKEYLKIILEEAIVLEKKVSEIIHIDDEL
ncbi:MAG: FHA domain-containing protein [Desulfobacteraceae bacterium]|jgi:GAF domain-containing protein